MTCIVPFRSELASDFKSLNLEWLEEFFYVEEHDRTLLEDFENAIIKPGGHIFFFRDNDETLGTAALIPFDSKSFEGNEYMQSELVNNTYIKAKKHYENKKKLQKYIKNL